MNSPEANSRLDALCAFLTTYFRVHLWAFAVGNGLLTVINIYTGAPWWALWPLLGWGTVFSVHFFVYKSLTVSEEWADERIDDLRWKSYDLGHVEDLEDRIRADDFSTRPAHRRDPDWWQQPKHDDTTAPEDGQPTQPAQDDNHDQSTR